MLSLIPLLLISVLAFLHYFFFLLSFLFFLNSFYLSYFNFTFLFCSSVLYFYSLFSWDPRLFSLFFHLILLSFVFFFPFFPLFPLFFSVCAFTVWTPFAVLKLPLFCFPSVLSCLSSTFNPPHSFVTFVTLLCSFPHTRSFFSDFFFATLLFLTFPPVSSLHADGVHDFHFLGESRSFWRICIL